VGEFSSHFRYERVSSGRPLSNLQAIQDSTSSMMVFKTEDMVETSAPAGTTPKRGTLLLTLFCSRPQRNTGIPLLDQIDFPLLKLLRVT